MPRRFPSTAVGFALLVTWALAAERFAQGAGVAALSGTVTDASGSVIPDAAVVLRNEGTGRVRALVTDAGGRFLATSMPVGTYGIEATAPGFSTQTVAGVVLTVGQAANIVVKLSVANVAETVSVTADATRLDVSSASK